jgi:hypothetical protein
MNEPLAMLIDALEPDAERSDHRDAMQAYGNTPRAKALEEGITEVYSYNNLNAYIDLLGLEEIAWYCSVSASPSYREYTPAAQTFANSIGRRSEVGSDEVIRRMAVVNAEQKWSALGPAAGAHPAPGEHLQGPTPHGRRSEE